MLRTIVMVLLLSSRVVIEIKNENMFEKVRDFQATRYIFNQIVYTKIFAGLRSILSYKRRIFISVSIELNFKTKFILIYYL